MMSRKKWDQSFTIVFFCIREVLYAFVNNFKDNFNLFNTIGMLEYWNTGIMVITVRPPHPGLCH
jgi:hypothetical protein